MEFLQLKYFITAAKCEHITKAAELLHIAQPALTQSVKRLETELGVKLFDRSGRNITLNNTGRMFLKRVEPIMSELDKLPDEIREASGMFESTIHMHVSAASLLVTKIIVHYKKLHPRVQISITHGENERPCDISITTTQYGNAVSNQYITTVSEDIMLAVPSDSEYARRGRINLADVSNEDFISLTGTLPLREICDRFCMSVGFLPHVAFESDSSDAVRDLISANMGIAFWPAFSWGPARKDNVSLIPIISPECRRNIVISKNKSTHSDVLSDFYEYMIRSIIDVKNGSNAVFIQGV